MNKCEYIKVLCEAGSLIGEKGDIVTFGGRPDDLYKVMDRNGNELTLKQITTLRKS